MTRQEAIKQNSLSTLMNMIEKLFPNKGLPNWVFYDLDCYFDD